MRLLGEVTEEVRERYGYPGGSIMVYGVDRNIGLTPGPKYVSSDLTRYKVIRPGMFAYNPMRLNIGSIGYCTILHAPGLVSPDYVVFKCDDNLLNPDFLFWYTKSQEWISWTESAGVGSVRTRIYYKELAEMSLSLPPIGIQNQIAQALSLIQSKMDLNDQITKTLETIAMTIFKSWFINFDPVSSKTQVMDLTGLDIDTISMFPIKLIESNLGKSPIGWKIDELGNHINLKKGKMITKATALPGKVPVVAGGTNPAYFHSTANALSPVITISASGANAGYVNLYFEDIWASDCSYLSNSDNEYIFFSYCLLKSIQTQIMGLQRGSAQPHVYPKDVMGLTFVFPTPEVIEQFENMISPLFIQIGSLQKQNTILSNVINTIAPKLMSGEIELPQE